MPKTVSFSEFQRLDMRVGKVLKAEKVDGSRNLLRFKVSFGAKKPRNILAGLAQYYKPKYFLGKHFVFAYNLEPKKMLGETSEGMILCADVGEKPVCLQVPKAKEGAKII